MSSDEEKVRAEVEADLRRMEEELEASNPGIVDLLEAYGSYEAAARQTSIYTQLLAPKALYFTSDRSNR
jgi:hypothetical protein